MTKLLICLIAIIAAIIVYTGACAIRVWYFTFHAKNPPIHQSDAALGSGGTTIRYIAAGDSTAVGEGASDAQHSYPYLIAEHLAQENSQKNTVDYRNVAVEGAETQDVIDKQLRQIIAYDPDIVTISIGANDRTHLRSNAYIYKNFQTIIETLTAQTHATIYVADIPNFHNQTLLPWPYVVFMEHRTTTLNPQLMALASDRVKIVDVHGYGWANFADIGQTISEDHFHPNDTGYQNWANAFLAQMPK